MEERKGLIAMKAKLLTLLTWGIDFSAVRREGKIAICGVTTGAIVETNLQKLY